LPATALGACLVFLQENKLRSDAKLPTDEWENFVLDVAASKVDRDTTTRHLRALMEKKGKRKR